MTTENVATDTKDLVKKRVLADRLGVCDRTIDSWVKAGRIPSIRITAHCIRYHVPSVMAALLEHQK